MQIPFSPPFVNDAVEQEVLEVLRSGWITTGPKTRALQEAFIQYTGFSHALAVNSWTSGAQLILKWFGVGPGDEVIVPAYTYCSTALVVIHAGAIPVLIDVQDDFTINAEAIENAITSKTKAVIPVDVAGWPAEYKAIENAVKNKAYLFQASTEEQKLLGRPLIISDAAHSIGAQYNKQAAGLFADISVYSFHAVKNITSAEGGMIAINLPPPFSRDEVYGWMRINTLNGQTKDAYSKSQGGSWKYDIISEGLKINMPDLCAAIALAQLRQYENHLLPERKRVANFYQQQFREYSWAQLNTLEDEKRVSSYHIFPLRIHGITEEQRDRIIEHISKSGVAVNVHFIPLPMLTIFKKRGYNIKDFPVSYDNYSREISLPIYPQLTNEQAAQVVEAVVQAVKSIIHSI